MNKYYTSSPKKIFEDITQSTADKKIRIKGDEFIVYPHVYPSDKFRTTDFLLDSVQSLFRDATVCDMGCGMGIVGLFALKQKAKSVVQVDVNPIAVENAKVNSQLYNYSETQIKIYESNCFDTVPKQTFDLIIFNIPFHSEPYEIEDPLEYAFHDPNFLSTKKFLEQVTDYSHLKTDIFIAFSNKGDTRRLEEIFDGTGFEWSLWKITNTHQEYDNRIYRLHVV